MRYIRNKIVRIVGVAIQERKDSIPEQNSSHSIYQSRVSSHLWGRPNVVGKQHFVSRPNNAVSGQ
jgi:hypothetical protein